MSERVEVRVLVKVTDRRGMKACAVEEIHGQLKEGVRLNLAKDRNLFLADDGARWLAAEGDRESDKYDADPDHRKTGGNAARSRVAS
jgi:hypothetical protein